MYVAEVTEGREGPGSAVCSDQRGAIDMGRASNSISLSDENNNSCV